MTDLQTRENVRPDATRFETGQLLFYRDHTRDGTGDVNTPSVIGLGGWQQFKFVFSGGEGIIYAVNEQGQLLFYRDRNRDGTGDVNTPSVIGQGGWQQMKHVFAGRNGIIYALSEEGELLFYRDHTRDGTGDVNTPSVIGKATPQIPTGWSGDKFLVARGNGPLDRFAGIYAVNQQGQLFCRIDLKEDGSEVINNQLLIGSSGWDRMQHLFAASDRILYAVDEQGRLLFYRDRTPVEAESIDVDSPAVIGLGGWQQFKFLFSGGDGIIYAVVA